MTLLDEAKEAKNFVKSVYPNSFFRNRNIFYTCFKSKIGLEIPISKDNISMILPFPSSIIEQLAWIRAAKSTRNDILNKLEY